MMQSDALSLLSQPSPIQSDWQTRDPYADDSLPAEHALTWREKDRFVRLNSQKRQNPKREAAITGGAVVAAGTFLGGLCAATAGAAAPLVIGAAALAVVTGVSAKDVNKAKPEGLRKYLFSDFDHEIPRQVSSQIVADLKVQGIYKNGRTRRLLQVENLPQAMETNLFIPEDKRDTVEALIRFHQEDVTWRGAVDECLSAHKMDFKSNRRPGRKMKQRDPDAVARYDATRAFKADLKTLKDAAPSRRYLAREWLQQLHDDTLETEKQVAFEHMLESIDRQADI